MKQIDIDTIKILLQKDDKMLEWGSGGSTLFFSQFVDEYISIEHDKDWHKQIAKKIPKNVRYFLVKPNKKLTKKHKGNIEQLKDYVEKINEFDKFDKILIDGRARVACAKEALNHLKKDGIVFVHDFWKRDRYLQILKWYKEIGSTSNKMIILKKR